MRVSNLFSFLKHHLSRLPVLSSRQTSRVLTFGTFDPIHDGHRWLFSRAKQLGDHLTVVVTRDDVIRTMKHREPYQKEMERVRVIQQVPEVDVAVLGDTDPASYAFLKQQDFDVLVVGHDQVPSDPEIQQLLHTIGKDHIKVVRMDAYFPDKYKSSLFRN